MVDNVGWRRWPSLFDGPHMSESHHRGPGRVIAYVAHKIREASGRGSGVFAHAFDACGGRAVVGQAAIACLVGFGAMPWNRWSSG